ncbi:unnamed protein product [Peniophora sp. CBMAI 1063]|nr:unnamed protein product [Peniophora sp. CBMAI 1063]
MSLAPPVSRLPSEILCVIFLSVHRQQDDDDRHDGAPPCLPLSHVCKRWREVTLGMQELWSAWPRYHTIDFHWTFLCCERAKTIPLDLKWRVWTSSKGDAEQAYYSRLRRTLLHASRAKSLDIDLGSSNKVATALWINEALPALSVPFPLLEVFSYQSDVVEVIDERMRCLPVRLFGGIIPPLLREVSLGGCEAPSCCPIYSANLRSLQLTDARAWTNVGDMIRLFQSIPNLEEFQYSLSTPYHVDFAYDYMPSQHHPLRAVDMHRMKSFQLFEAKFIPGILIFSYLALPAECGIYFGWSEYGLAEEMDQREIEHALRYMHIGAQALSLHFSSALEENKAYYQSVKVSNKSVRPLRYLDIDKGRRLPLDISLQAPLLDTRQMRMRDEPLLLTALQPVFLQATYLLLTYERTFSESDDDDGDEWIALWLDLHHYQKVTELHLSGDTLDCFAAYLRLREVRSYPPLFPALGVITISHFDFIQSAEDTAEDGRSVLHDFGTAVERAYGASASFERVYVGASCKGQKDAIKRLRLYLGTTRVRGDARE